MQKGGIRFKPQYILLTLLALATLWFFRFSGATAAPRTQTQDLAVITSPASNAVVGGVVDIIGSADHPAFQFYVIEFSPEPVTGDQWQTAGVIHETPVLNGLLTQWDTTVTPDGSYTLRLRTVRLDGNYTEFFATQVVVANSQPTPTNTPLVIETPTPGGDVQGPVVEPTITPTDLPPTPTILIEQPIVETATPRPVETSAPLDDPEEENSSFVPTISGFSVTPLQDACLFGGGIMLVLFLFFGFLSALRLFVNGFTERRRRK